MDVIPLSLVIVFCIACSAFFSSTETAFTTVNRLRMKSLAESGEKKAARVLRLTDDYDKLLSTILIGNNLVNIVATSLATVLFEKLIHGPSAVTVSTGVMTITVLIFGEITPKSLAKQNSESYCMATASLLHGLIVLFTPLNFLFMQWNRLVNRLSHHKDENKTTSEDLMTLVDEAQNDGGINEENGELIRSAIEFEDLEANDILTPRVDLTAVRTTVTMEELGKVFVNWTFSRVLVYEDTIDNIVGMIHEKDYFAGSSRGLTTIRPLIKKVIYVSGSTKISKLLRLIQQSKTHMAVVVDEFGGTEGIVTLEDILEQLVGEIWDEHDVVENDFEKIDDHTYLIAGNANLEDFFDQFELPFDEDEYESFTVGGWVMEELGHIPEPGDHFVYRGCDVYVMAVEKRHATQIRLILPPEEEEKEDD